MKHHISDALQVIAALLITTSLVVANASPIPQKQTKDATPVATVAKTTIAEAPQPAPEVVPAPETVVDPTPAPAPVVAAPVASQPVYTGSHEDLMASAGIDPSDYWAVDYIVSRESGWNACASYPSTYDCSLSPINACGLVMQNPCGKISGDWRDPVAALVWQKGYVAAKYGGYSQAVAHWKAYGNY